MDNSNYLLVYKCVLDHNFIWPEYCERYLLLDTKVGWNYAKGDSVYYGDFEKMCDSLGKKMTYGDRND